MIRKIEIGPTDYDPPDQRLEIRLDTEARTLRFGGSYDHGQGFGADSFPEEDGWIVPLDELAAQLGLKIDIA